MTPPAAASARTAAPLAPRRRPPVAPRPRRISGPARNPAREAPTRAKPQRDGLLFGLLDALESLSSHRMLDRLVRGRMWIGIVAFALIGIVTLQLGLLKLNSGIGRALERQATLQRENAALSIENSELASGDRVESQAERLGMSLVSIADLHFLDSHAGSDVARAAAALRKPIQPRETSAESSTETSSAATASGEEAATTTGGEAEQTTQPQGSTAAGGEAPPAGSEASTTTGGEAPSASSTTAGAAPSNSEAGGGTEAPGG